MRRLQQKLNIVLFLMLLITISGISQSDFTSYVEPGIEISYPISEKYQQRFSLIQRSIMYKDDAAQFKINHIEFAHLSTYQVSTRFVFGFGLKYRLRHTFMIDKKNELRLQEQVVYTPKSPGFKTTHRLRIEQRLYPSTLKHRFRYQLGYKFMLNDTRSSSPFIKASTESLLELATTQKPELEQRLTITSGWRLSEKTSLQLGAEYQLEDFSQALTHELFVVAELNLSIE